ncbi:hypothetical protein NKR23_g437 [Pleurostoma richardsiae]|uniref:Clock-controlled pheromone ccg-4 n=1 Tax=Pleurostoma richardsiae TaxID=41990 RepID=A0AA38VLC0_9PEZI|nr:hypothetical protein NKR23_g437 [Pleurostoma richardsiae]
MKFVPILLAIVATVSAAPAAEAEAEPDGWCRWPGQPCWKVKRVAEAFADALGGSGAVKETREAAFSGVEGNAALTAKRAVDNLATHISLAQRDPAAYYNGLGLYHSFAPDFFGPPPTGQGDADAAPAEKRDAAAEPDGWCTWPGQPCWKNKRDAEAEADGWCRWPGQPCWKTRRAAEAVVSTIEGFAKEKRDAAAEPDGWCRWPGQPCWKNKRDVDSVEARCNAVDGACSVARRDLEAIEFAARSMLADN